MRSVNAALVMDGGKPKPRIISCHSFFEMTATIPPLWTTSLYNVYKSKTRFAIIGSRLIGVPVNKYVYLLKYVLTIDTSIFQIFYS